MNKELRRYFKLSILFICVITFSIGSIGLNHVEAATNLPDNHKIEQLKVEYYKNQYKIHVGDRAGTLLIRYERPKTERDVEWLNWSLSGTTAVNMGLELEYDPTMGSPIIPFNHYESYDYDSKGAPDKWAKEVGRLWGGVQKFSGYEYPNYYIGAAVYLPKMFNEDGIYYFINNYYAMKEDGQVKAYFYEDRYVVKEAMDRVKTGGIFPLMSKVMWGKTELWKGQLGKVTVKKPTILWEKDDNGKYQIVHELKAGDEYRVYRYLEEANGYYGVGSGMYVQRDTSKVLYETPSKKNLRLVWIMNGEE